MGTDKKSKIFEKNDDCIWCRKATLYESAWLEGSIVKVNSEKIKVRTLAEKRSWSLYMSEYISILYSCVNN